MHWGHSSIAVTGHPSHSWQSSCLCIQHLLSLLSAPQFPLTHWSGVPSPLHSSKFLVLDGHLAKKCRGACVTMEGCYLPCKDTIQQKITGQETEYAWLTLVCHVDLHQGTPSPRQPCRSPSAISSSGMKMQNDKPLPCGVSPRALTFPIPSLLPQTP